ncbi:MAG TPA: HNH endonuclease [Pyrinomonadaceae bacterium]|nr:HNH endonuclease [Pyrinomonadaceae bacterium]
MTDSFSFYLRKIKSLRRGRAHGSPTPHKPLLLLTIIDLIEQGAINRNRIEPSPQLVETYLSYYSQVGEGWPRPFLPFFHLKTSGFWHLHARKGQEAALEAAQTFNSMSQLSSIVDYANLDDELFALLLDPPAREVIRQTIIDAYLPTYRTALESVFQHSRNITDVTRLLELQAEGIAVASVPPSPVRSAAFRREIMGLYNYTCAACHLRIVTLDGKAAVDAAHIVPFAESHDDSIGNGLALCKLHHWSFEYGLIVLDDELRVLINSNFDEQGPRALLLRNLNGQRILLPAKKPYFPSLQAVRHHRAKWMIR